MFTIFKKEINSFFTSLIGYLTIIVFLVAIGLFMWVFPETNALDYGYATLDQLFTISPWIFMFLIPAVTMRLFAEESKTGTIELLITRPVSEIKIILGKYFAALCLLIFALLPTLVYYYSIYKLGFPPGNLDTGATLGSYIGLLMLGASFTAIGVFVSSLTNNQIIAFILGVFLCFFFYIGFEYASKLDIFYGKTDDIIQLIGINSHYTSISRGVLDTRDIIYFISVISIFILFTKVSLESRKW